MAEHNLTEEELNSLSPRARKALGNDMIQEIVEVNPNAIEEDEVLDEEEEEDEDF